MLELPRPTYTMHSRSISLMDGTESTPIPSIHISYNSTTQSLLEIRAINERMDVLMEISALRYSKTLPQTLASLKRMTKLAELAMKTYESTPLATALDEYLVAQVEDCRQLFQEILADLSNYRQAISTAMLQLARQYICSRMGESSAISAADSKLRECYSSFASSILAIGRLVICIFTVSPLYTLYIARHGQSWNKLRGQTLPQLQLFIPHSSKNASERRDY